MKYDTSCRFLRFRQFLSIALILAALGLPLQAAADQTLADALWFERPIGDGVVWRYYLFDDLFGSMQSVSYVEADLNNPNVTVEIPYLAASRARTSSIIPSQFSQAVGGVNGTFFDTSSGGGGHTTYLRIDNVEIPRQSTSKSTWSWNGAMAIDSAGAVDVIEMPAGGWAAETTHPDIIANGPILIVLDIIQSSSFASIGSFCAARHPRSAVGVTADNRLILLTADGRTELAKGMTCAELADVMQQLGCTDALNLDGGGSTTLWAKGEPYNGVVNYPSDNGAYDHLGERSCSNAIATVSTAPLPVPWDGRMTGLTSDSLTRSKDPYVVTATYTNLGTETWTTSNVKMVPSRPFGRASDFVPSGEESTFFSMTPASVATGETATFTLNLIAPEVASDTVYVEHFALEHTTEGHFGPADSELRFAVTVRPELSGAPPVMIVQGTSTGPNNQWYFEGPSGWGNSSVSFTAEGVSNSGTQRYCSAASTGRYARFQPIFDVPGIYKVEVAFPSSSNNITEVRYTVSHLQGASEFTLNQNPSGGLNNEWNLLGEFEFGTETAGGGTMGVHSVEVGNPTLTGNRFYSGAVRFDYVKPLNAGPSWGTY